MTPKILSVFNNKGGVGKTTLSKEIGSVLAFAGHRVLLVDADPQCNLTGLCLPQNTMEQLYTQPVNSVNNIWSALAPVFSGSVTPLAAAAIQPLPNTHGNLFLLPGHIDFSAYESDVAMSLLSFTQTMVQIPGALRHVLELTANANNIEYVIVDLSPSLGALNEDIIMMTSDCFVVPCAPDFFCVMAIKGLMKKLPAWKNRKNDVLQRYSNFNAAMYKPTLTMPKLVGLVFNKYTPYRSNVSKGDREVIDQMDVGGLFNELNNNAMMGARATVQTLIVGYIRDFGKLQKVSQQTKTSVSSLGDNDIQRIARRGKVFNDYVNKCDNIETEITDVVLNILDNM